MIASAPPRPAPDNSFKEFSWEFGTVAATFLLGGALLAYLCDVVLISIAVLLDMSGYPNSVGQMARAVSLSGFITGTPLALVVMMFMYSMSAVFAVLSFVIFGRVSLWWMVATAPLATYRAGFSFFAEQYWQEVNIPVLSPRFFTLLAIQTLVVVVCWWWIRNVRRPALWEFTDHVRSNSVE
jgi:hypothetical protein